MSTSEFPKTVQLLLLDKKLRTGRLYSEAVMRPAVERLNDHLGGKALPGEVSFEAMGTPNEPTDVKMERFPTAQANRFSHQLENIRIEGEFVVGDVTPTGPYKDLVEKTLPHFCFGMRSFIYAKDKKIERVNIISFDLLWHWDRAW